MDLYGCDDQLGKEREVGNLGGHKMCRLKIDKNDKSWTRSKLNPNFF